MKVLIVCQYYYPEPFRISNLCEELVSCGNEVTVITGTPNYPMGNVYVGYEKNLHSDERINGVNVHRCAIHPRKKGAFHRLWNYYSFSYHSTRYIKTLDSTFDVVFIYQLSPVIMAYAGIYYAKKYNKKSILYCLDLWPASLSTGGINNGIIYKWFYKVSKKIYTSVDKVLISSRSFAKYFKDEFGIEDTEYLPQYAEETFTPVECKKEPNEYFDLMFAGNVGSAQSVDTIIKAAALCKDISNLRWHIVGDGKELANCIELSKKLSAPVIFHGRKPMEDMPYYYSLADVMLVTMKKNRIINMTLPGKVQSYMASGKPIIGCIDGECADVINSSKCGLCVPAEDECMLSQCVREIMYNKSILKIYASNSRLYYEKNYDKKIIINRMRDLFYESIND